MVFTVTTLLDVPGLKKPIKLREERDNDVVPLRTGCRVWSCARLLARKLVEMEVGVESASTLSTHTLNTSAHYKSSIRDKDVLELGSGVGAVGFTCAMLGAASVTLTDRDDATLSLMHTNARINGFYDLQESNDSQSNNDDCEVSIHKLDWGDGSTYINHHYDLVIAADVLYLPEHCVALPDAVVAHLKPGGKVVVACGLRRAGLIDLLVEEFRKKGLSPVIDRGVLSIDNDEVDEMTKITASEHVHDGEQIQSNGGYVLLTCDAPEEWLPPRLDFKSEQEDVSYDEEFETTRQTTVSAPPKVSDRITQPGGVRYTQHAPCDSETLSDVGSDANSLMGDFLDEFGGMEVEGPGSGSKKPYQETLETLNSNPKDYPPYRVRVSKSDQTRGFPSDETILIATKSLCENGFVVLDPPDEVDGNTFHGLVTELALDQAFQATGEWLETLVGRCRAMGIDPEEDIFRFAEVCSRAKGGKRFDITAERRRGSGDELNEDEAPISIPVGGPLEVQQASATASISWDKLRRECDEWVTPVLKRSGLMDGDGDENKTNPGMTTAVGCVVSYPNAPAQHFHADGRERGIVNVFIPLEDVPSEKGPTAFKLGSHRWDHSNPYPTRDDLRALEMAPIVTTTLKKGSLLLYDYRVMHCGGANRTGEIRPIAYVMRSRRGLEDTWNFPENSIWDEKIIY